MVGVKVQALVVQAAVPFCVLAPVIATETVGFTPAAVVHAPPSVVTVALVVNGNVRAVPLTVVSVTVGAAVLIVIDCAPRRAGVAGGVGLRRGDRVGAVGRRARARACTSTRRRCRSRCRSACGAGDRDRARLALSPDAVPHAPPTVVTVVLVVYGKVRTVPLTVVSVTTGAVRSTVIVCAPLVPRVAAASVCVAVTSRRR